MGTFVDTDELIEIENVAKVFLVEKRMKTITDDIDKRNILKISDVKTSSKSNSRRFHVYDRLQYLNVRGLN